MPLISSSNVHLLFAMKSLKSLFLLTGLLLTSSGYSQILTVHEWGTFTTLSGSDGGTLSGLYYEEEQLPGFVYHHTGFSPDPSVFVNGYRPCKHVTVKMETPVLYFYSEIERDVTVKVDFPNGTISQWYPERSGGETDPVGDIDLSIAQTGSIEWDATVLALNTTKQFTHQAVIQKWEEPRQTDANLIENHKGEVEKYLFYRGLANVELPVEVKFGAGDGNLELTVSNKGALDIPFIYIYDHSESHQVRIWGIGPLPAGASKIFTKPTKYYASWEENIDEYPAFATALVNAGLTEKEALAMLRTWTSGYFQTMGFKVFWIVPRELTDAVLPIQITPNPDLLERVLVGKSEILTPELEARLVADYLAGTFENNWKQHHYYLAFKQRMEQLVPAKVESELLENTSVFPNPVGNTLFIRGTDSQEAIHCSLRNILGEVVGYSILPVTAGVAQLNVSHLPTGIYILHAIQNGQIKAMRIIKD